jgi:hypothetical protein
MGSVRMEFEAFAKGLGYDLTMTPDRTFKNMIYLNPYLESMWKGWSAAHDRFNKN